VRTKGTPEDAKEWPLPLQAHNQADVAACMAIAEAGHVPQLGSPNPDVENAIRRLHRLLVIEEAAMTHDLIR
jgi:hypothetical protein